MLDAEVVGHLALEGIHLRAEDVAPGPDHTRCGLEERVHRVGETDRVVLDIHTAGIAVDRTSLKTDWTTTVTTVLQQATLDVPADDWSIAGGREGIHTEHLGYLLAELQFLQRAYPGQQW